MSSTSRKMRPVVPVPKRANGFSIDSIMGKTTGQRSPTPPTTSDESEQGDELQRIPSSPRSVGSPVETLGLSGFGSRLPPLHPALPTHVQQLLLSDPAGRASQELLGLRSQTLAAFGHHHIGTFPALGPATVVGPGLNVAPQPIHGLHQPGQVWPAGLLQNQRDPLSMMYPWMVARQGPGLMGLPYGPPDSGFFFHPYRKPKRIRTAFSPGQLLKLEQAFEKNHYVVGQERKDLASKLSLTETQVKVWFQNRRTKHKRVRSEGEEDDTEHSLHGDDDEVNVSAMNYHSDDNHEQFQERIV